MTLETAIHELMQTASLQIFGTKAVDVAILRPKERDGQIYKSAGDRKHNRRFVKTVRCDGRGGVDGKL